MIPPSRGVSCSQLGLFLVKNVCQVTSTTVLSVVHGGHEHTSAAILRGALASETLDLAIAVHLVVLENRQLSLLALVLDLLWGGVHLLLPLLGTTTQPKDEMECRLLLDVVVRQGSAVLELFPGENQSLLIRRNSFFV